MRIKILIAFILGVTIAGCNYTHEQEHEGHDEHESPKFQYTAYNSDYELFAEADPFVIGKTANVLAHFSVLPEFKALEKGEIDIVLTVKGIEKTQTLESPTRKGIYSFDIMPETAGEGSLKFKIVTGKDTSVIVTPEIKVFSSDEEANEMAEKNEVSKANTVVFTKEQSWKIDFATELPVIEPFGKVIKTVAQVESTQSGETVITAKTSGTVILLNNYLFEGQNVTSGQVMFSLSAEGLADNNIMVKVSEARNNYEKAKADYERQKELSENKIISEKELLESKNIYENAKVVYDNLSKHFNALGQVVISPANGFIKQVFVKNGQYVETGQALLTVSQNKTLVLRADVQQKYVSDLADLRSANIRDLRNKQTYSFDELNGKILSVGQSATSDNFLIPVRLQISNNGNFVQGSFVDVFLKTIASEQALTVPNTALLEEQGVYFVFAQITPELFEKREVSVGATDGLRTEIIKGLKSDERIVTKGAILVKLAQSSGALDAHSGHVH